MSKFDLSSSYAPNVICQIEVVINFKHVSLLLQDICPVFNEDRMKAQQLNVDKLISCRILIVVCLFW